MIYTARKECGAQLAIQAPVEADVVGSVPESSTPAALGFSEQVIFICHCIMCTFSSVTFPSLNN